MSLEQPNINTKLPLEKFVENYLAELQRSGKWTGQKRRVFDALRRNPGLTSAEIANLMGGDRYIPSRRLPDLERAGLVKRGRARTCAVTKSQCITWWPNPDIDGPLLYENARN